MPFWRPSRRSLGLLLPVVLLALAPVGTAVATDDSADDRTRPKRTYIVTLSVADAGRAIDPAGRSARQRIRKRATRTAGATDQLAAEYGFRTRHRYSNAVAGFSARLTAKQAAQIRREANVASIRPARRYRIAGEVVPRSLRRVRAAPSGAPRPDVDVDIAVLDTGIGPVGGNELNIRGGINCSGDGRPETAWQDLFNDRHGTHVAGTAAARDNSIGTVGVAPGARLWSVRVFRASGYGDESTIVCGMDWAVSTHGPGAPPGTQPIEVINMSLQGPRIADPQEACAAGTDPDPMHEAVCAAFAAGITLVVAAGNDSSDAAATAPAGYDQVITVGAISDFDGVGGGAASSDCEFFEREKDDSYARYSNYGQDVDILAPGTCVTSTSPSAAGDKTRILSGTSMATPHVSGAVARYLAIHPGTSPSQMRKLVRASGRLDWRTTSDPHWFGPNDPDSPNRVLDVKALLGTPALRTWLLPARVHVGGTSKTRSIRVEVQRSGGFDGDVQLSVDGLLGAVASTEFDRTGAALTGLNGLGARLTMRFKVSAPEGPRTPLVHATGSGGSPAAAGQLDVLVDRSGPDGVVRTARFGPGRQAVTPAGVAPITVNWRTTDAHSKVRKSELQRRVAAQSWKLVMDSAGKSRVRQNIKPHLPYRYRVQATDVLGNKATSSAFEMQLRVIDSHSPKWLRPASGWSAARTRSALGGSLLLARGPTGSLTTTFGGRAMAVVAPIGPRRGAIRIRVDGESWHHVNLRSKKGASRRIVYSRRYEDGTHNVEIRSVRGTSAIDALLVLE